MNNSPLTEIYDRWTRPSYEVRVRGTAPMFLWGSAGITENLTFDKPLILHIRNETLGEAVTFGTRVASGTQKKIGTLQPGECVSIPVQDVSGVFASCVLESTVACVITGPT
jgi:hypothetical protein